MVSTASIPQHMGWHCAQPSTSQHSMWPSTTHDMRVTCWITRGVFETSVSTVSTHALLLGRFVHVLQDKHCCRTC